MWSIENSLIEELALQNVETPGPAESGDTLCRQVTGALPDGEQGLKGRVQDGLKAAAMLSSQLPRSSFGAARVDLLDERTGVG